jgi:hypothetical protein
VKTTAYAEGERIPTEDWGAYSEHGKDKGDCLIVGCPNKADCDEHWLSPEKQRQADRAYQKGCDMAMAYCWGRGDAGDAVATDQANWYPFTKAYGRMQFEYALEKRSMGWSVRSAWERYTAGEAL